MSVTAEFAGDKVSPYAVHLIGVSKTYAMAGAPGRLLRLRWGKKPDPQSAFFALRNISLEVKPGRSIGILGLNGAGKSTLLSIIAGNIRPTSGTVGVNGQAQLLRLGGDFTPELTGRQNVVAYARSRGVPGSEIERRVAYVEEFADIGPFFDQPIRTYSSGMRGRVAFGNAFAVDPEILVVDEALAVGDAVFVNKCYRRLNEARDRGTTFIYTSHSMDSVVRLCDDGVVLHRGELYFTGTAKDAANRYSALVHAAYFTSSETPEAGAAGPVLEPATREPSSPKRGARRAVFQFTETDDTDRSSNCALYNPSESAFGSGHATIVDCKALRNGAPAETNFYQLGDVLELIVRVYFHEDMDSPNLGFTLTSVSGECFYATNQDWLGDRADPARKGESRQYRLRFTVRIAPGPWFIDLAIANPRPPVQKRCSMLHFVVGPTARQNAGPGWLDFEITGPIAGS